MNAGLLAAVAGPATRWESPGVILFQLLAIAFPVALNGFFVASEFAIVKVRTNRLQDGQKGWHLCPSGL
jgi:hypothetical protein